MEITQAKRGGAAAPALWAAAGLAAIVVLPAIYLGYVFRLQSGIWLRFGLGDWIDPYLINALLEQWSYSVRHLTSPISPPMFFPARGTLGYSHSLVLYAPFYLIARLALHPFLAHTLTILTVIEIGILSLYAVFRRFLATGVGEALLLVTAFATSQNVVNGPAGVWSQRASVFLIPPILLIGLAAARRGRGPTRSLGLGAAAFLGASLFTHDIYTGLLSAVVALPLAIGAVTLYGAPPTGIRLSIPPTRRPRERVRSLALPLLAFVAIITLAWAWVLRFDGIFWIPFPQRHHHWERPLIVAMMALAALEILRGGLRNRIAIVDRAAALDLAAIAGGVALGFAGFVWVYRIAFAEFHGFSAQDVMGALVQRNTADWMRIFSAPGSWLPFDSGRPFAIVFAVAAACCVPGLGISRRVRLSALWLAIVALIVLAIPMRIGNFALWKLVAPLPGFSAIRDPKRIISSFDLAAALGLGVVLSQLARGSLLRRAIPLVIAVAIALTWNQERFDYERPIDAFQRWVEAPIAVDRDCRSFFIKEASTAYISRSPHMAALYGIDATFVATKYAVPTLNGYSAWEPPDWHLRDPHTPEYSAGVDDWIARHHLDHVCELDIDTRTMTPYQRRSGQQ